MATVEAIHSHRVVIPWHNTIEHMAEWTEGSVWAIENFGLPGDRYICSPTKEGMEFWFRKESDSVFMMLRWIK